VVWTLRLVALATADRLPWAREATGGEPVGWQRWRRQRLEQTRDHVIGCAHGDDGLLPRAASSRLVGGTRNDGPPGLGTRRDVLATDGRTLRGAPFCWNLRTYTEENHAYYVASMFRSFTELNEAQVHLQTASDFLKHFVCIEISRLPDVVDFFQYKWPDTHRSSPNLRFKMPGDGCGRTAIHPITGAGWLRGSTLFEKFRAKEIGAIIFSSNADIHRKAPEDRMGVDLLSEQEAWEPLSSGAYEHAAHCAPSDFGVMMRQRVW
jgi:hypothetical protein